MIELRQRPSLSVVVIGRNEGARLKRCLDSIQAMRKPAGGLELIYVDSSSTDESVRIASEGGARVIVVQSRRPTAALGRNAGWRAVSASFIFFVDADTVVDPDFVTRALPEFRDPQVAVVFGRTRELCPNASVFHRVYDIQWWNPPPGPVEYCAGTSLVRRSALEAVNGYDSILMGGEEPEMCARLRRMGCVILCVDIPMVAHDLAMTCWSQYWWRMMRSGYGYAEVAERFSLKELHDYHRRIRRTLIWGTLLMCLPVLATLASFLLGSWLPLSVTFATLVTFVLQAAWDSRHRRRGWLNCVLFGIHSYVKEIPQLYGHIRYFLDKRTGRKTLIEYKTRGGDT